MMPQKKNPDVAEVVRGKTGRVVGDLVALLVTLKGLPLAYNRDLQEDKPPLFDAVDAVAGSLTVLERCVSALRVKRDNMARALGAGFVNATEVADYLAAKGVPFRDAHAVAGKLVARAIEAGCELGALPLSDYREEHAAFGDDVFAALEPSRAIERRVLVGGPAKAQVSAQIRDAIARIEQRASGEGGET
jgi:argininosuccinate lyase